jgi:hypothetical protein
LAPTTIINEYKYEKNKKLASFLKKDCFRDLLYLRFWKIFEEFLLEIDNN